MLVIKRATGVFDQTAGSQWNGADEIRLRIADVKSIERYKARYDILIITGFVVGVLIFVIAKSLADFNLE